MILVHIGLLFLQIGEICTIVTVLGYNACRNCGFDKITHNLKSQRKERRREKGGERKEDRKEERERRRER